MYVNPFIAGIIATLLAESIVILAAAVIAIYRDNKRKK